MESNVQTLEKELEEKNIRLLQILQKKVDAVGSDEQEKLHKEIENLHEEIELAKRREEERKEQDRLNKLPLTRGDLMKLFDGESEDTKLHEAFEEFLKVWANNSIDIRLDYDSLHIDADVKVW